MNDENAGILADSRNQNSPRFELRLEIDFTDKQQELMETLFDPKRVEYEEYRQQILPFYIARAQAEAEAQKFGLMLKEPGKYPVKGADTKALREEAFEEAKKRVHQADAGVKQKLEEIAPLIVIRK